MALVDPAVLESFDAVIFDYGCVLVTDQTPDDHTRMSAIAGVPVDQLMPAYWADRLSYDRGDLSNVDFWQANAARCGVSLGPEQIAQLTDLDNRSWMRYDETMWQWVAELRTTGKRLAMLSNMPKDLGEVLRSETDRFHSFDHLTLSYQVRSVKPDRPIYEHCLNGIGTAPERTLFLDDRAPNIEAAEALGIRSVQFVTSADLFAQLSAR